MTYNNLMMLNLMLVSMLTILTSPFTTMMILPMMMMMITIFSYSQNMNHVLILLMYLEMMSLSIIIMLTYLTLFYNLNMIIMFSTMIFIVCESVMGLSLLISYTRNYGNDTLTLTF